MKNILCYFGILILFVLGALPPVLRTFYNPEEEKKEETIIESAILICTSDTYITTTNYEGDKVKKIAIKKIIVNNSEDDQEETEDPLEQEEVEKTGMDLLYDTLKENDEVIQNPVEDGEVIRLDFYTSKYETVDLVNLTKNKEEQKKYYESLNLTCNIRK